MPKTSSIRPAVFDRPLYGHRQTDRHRAIANTVLAQHCAVKTEFSSDLREKDQDQVQIRYSWHLQSLGTDSNVRKVTWYKMLKSSTSH